MSVCRVPSGSRDSAGGILHRSLRAKRWEEHQGREQEDAPVASVVSLARKHPRTAEHHRAFGHTLRNGDFLDRRKLVTKAAVSDRTEEPNGASRNTPGAREGND